MLGKTFFLATILLFTLLIKVVTAQAKALNTTQIQALIDNGVYLTTERWRVRMSFVELPSQFELEPATQCYQSQIENFLATQIEGQDVKIEFDKAYKSTQLHRSGKIKFDKKYDLAEFFLKNGWAKLTEPVAAPKLYRQAQALAKAQRLGMWGACDNWYKLREVQRLRGHSAYFNERQKHYLGSNSMGWVRKVLAPNRLELDSGQIVKLQGLTIPNDNTPLSRCWEDWVRESLEKQLVGRKIELEYDQLELAARGQSLQRYVWLRSPGALSPTLLNALMVEEGWAHLKVEELYLKNIEAMKAAQQAFEQKSVPPLWWQQCAQKIVLKPSSEEALGAALVYDEKCPIKGNISGSKKSPQKTFHTPLSGWYQRIEAEACFADEAAAEAAGFKKVR